MLKEKEFPVYGDNGVRGTLLSAARFLDPSPEKRIRLEDGREIVVPSSALTAQPDGSYYLKTNQNNQTVEQPPRAAEEPSRPEQPRVRQAEPPTPEPEPRPSAAVSERRAAEPEPRKVFTASAADALFRDDCEVERVPVKRILDRPAEIRQDGDTLIIPLMEEVLVVEKRLMLREELHIKRRRENKPDDARTPIPADQLGR